MSIFATIFNKVVAVAVSALVAVGIISAPLRAIPVEQQKSNEIASQTQQITNQPPKHQKEERVIEKSLIQVVAPRAEADIRAKVQESNSQNLVADLFFANTQRKLEISNIKIQSDISSATIEWETNLISESKIFFKISSEEIKVIPSASNNSIKHSAVLRGLSQDTLYSFEIEAISSMDTNILIDKKISEFKTGKIIKYFVPKFTLNRIPDMYVHMIETRLNTGEIIPNKEIFVPNGFFVIENPPTTRYISDKNGLVKITSNAPYITIIVDGISYSSYQ